MKFDDWLNAEKMSSAEFARLSGIGERQAVHKYRHGERFPTPENLQRIRKATGGAVTANDFADQHAPSTPPDGPRPKRSPANDAPIAKAKRRSQTPGPASSAAAA